MRRAAHTDGNQAEIVAALRAAGAFVQSLAAVGDGCPDLLVIRGQRVFLLEVKDPRQDPNKRALRPSQVVWHAKANGLVHVVLTIDEALQVIGAVTR